jgi:hypothetical protein
MKLNNQNINTELLEAIAAAAVTKLENSKCTSRSRWINAVKKAVKELQSNCYWSYDARNFDFVIMSETSNEIYSVNTYCGCTAAGKAQPCKHRAMHRLLMRYAAAAA